MEPQLAEEDRPPATLSMAEYLSSTWSPDCDFVDGHTEERNLGTFGHSSIVTALLWMLADKQEPWRALALPSLRIRVSPTRVRIPDVCVIGRGSPREKILTHPPLAVFEVLEEEDRFSATIEKLRDFQQFGVAYIWTIDPDRSTACHYVGGSLLKVQNGELAVPNTPIKIGLSEMFAELDRA